LPYINPCHFPKHSKWKNGHKNPLGYNFGFSVKFPKGKTVIVSDQEKGESIPINEKNLESKLKEQNLNPYLVKQAETKHNEGKYEKEQIYQIFFNYVISEEKIYSFRNLHTKEPKETIKDDFRANIKKPLEESINYLVNLKLK
jgi:hypothetical protein